MELLKHLQTQDLTTQNNQHAEQNQEVNLGSTFPVVNQNRQHFTTITVAVVHDRQGVIEQSHQELINQDTNCVEKEKHHQNNLTTQIQSPNQLQQIHPQPIYKDNIETSSIYNDITEQQQFQFQVVVHKIDSSQSIPENQNQYQISFTKSQLEIPIDIQEVQAQKEEKVDAGYVNIWEKDRAVEDDDVYVRMLEEKWAKREEKQAKTMKKSIEREQEALIKKNPSDPLLFIQQLCKISSPTTNEQTIINTSTTKLSLIQDPIKKAGFIIKKLKDDRFNYSTMNPRPLKASKQQRTILQNKSELLNMKSSPKHNRLGKKHVSNFESSSNSPQRNQRPKEDKMKNVQYEIFLGNEVQKMSQILQDRCYNGFASPNKDKENHAKGRENTVENVREESCNKVRKIIKRSPYGILQLQVKDNRNKAKITNLRILKPKEMVHFKKIPNTISKNKENLFQ